jgi:hypothetical protein
MLKVKPHHLLETIGLVPPTQQGLKTVLNMGRTTSDLTSPTGSTGSNGSYEKDKQSTATIRDVWMTNFFEELEKLSSLVDQGFNIISFVSLSPA